MASSTFRPFNIEKSKAENPKLLDLSRAGADVSPLKMDMIYGMYFNEEGSVETLKSVEDAIKIISDDKNSHHVN